jgi:hypothetical protein
MQEGVEGLLRDKTRPSRIPALTPEVIAWVAARTHEEPPGETTHWTASLMASEARISASSVHRIWRAHGLQPHRVRQFKLSNDESAREDTVNRIADVARRALAEDGADVIVLGCMCMSGATEAIRARINAPGHRPFGECVSRSSIAPMSRPAGRPQDLSAYSCRHHRTSCLGH